MLKKLKGKIVQHYLKRGECSCTENLGTCCETKRESDETPIKVMSADPCCKK